MRYTNIIYFSYDHLLTLSCSYLFVCLFGQFCLPFLTYQEILKVLCMVGYSSSPCRIYHGVLLAVKCFYTAPVSLQCLLQSYIAALLKVNSSPHNLII